MGIIKYEELGKIGEWEHHWWGLRWILNHEEIERIIKKVEINKVDCTKRMGIVTGFSVTAAALNVIAFPPAAVAGFMGAISALSIGSFALFKLKLEDSDIGNGVTIDFPLKYFSLTIGGGEIYKINTRY